MIATAAGLEMLIGGGAAGRSGTQFDSQFSLVLFSPLPLGWRPYIRTRHTWHNASVRHVAGLCEDSGGPAFSMKLWPSFNFSTLLGEMVGEMAGFGWH